jgi:hypothetical protein
MTRAKKVATSSIAVALTWDGSRGSLRAVPRAARAFLGLRAEKNPGPKILAERLAGGQIGELRICWLPRLQGGDAVLAAPFVTNDGLRLNFRAVQQRQFGDALVVVYRRR